MADTLRHRGPDGENSWSDDLVALGHTRLSIIDLSELGCQPMHDDTGRYVMVYNGEVYNYIELRKELEGKGHRFRSATDSEVVLHAFREWGEDALPRFNGMWALAIWDRVTRQLFAARDRAGKKPFYHARDARGDFYFASEIKALRVAGLRFGLNLQAAFDFLTQGTYGHLGARGFFDGVEQLLPGHFLWVKPGEMPDSRSYWRLPVIRERDRLRYDASFRTTFRELFTDAVRLRLRSDVPVGLTLSGGLDSSTIALVVDRLTGGRPMHVFTSLYPGSRHDETPYFEAVVAGLRSPLIHRVTPIGGEQWREDLLRVLDHQEEPFGDTSILAHFHIMQAARTAGVPVVLSGQGGDELLMGYPSIVRAYLGHQLRRGRWIRTFREAALLAHGSPRQLIQVVAHAAGHALPLGAIELLRSSQIHRHARLVTPELRGAVTYERFWKDAERNSFDRWMAQLFTRFSIPHLTHYDDRNAMAFSVEGRMPFLDHRVVELLSSVEYEALYRSGVSKRVLRESFDDLLPPIVVGRNDKVGFHTPMAQWLRHEWEWIVAFMSRDRIVGLGLIDPLRYGRSLEALRAGSPGVELEIWRGLILHLWAERFGVASPELAR